MPLYKKKPVTIEARQTPTDKNDYQEAIKDIVEWIFEADKDNQNQTLLSRNSSGHLVIYTLEGPMTVTPGWWIIKGVKGEFYPCDPTIFEMTYDFIGPNGYDAPYMVN